MNWPKIKQRKTNRIYISWNCRTKFDKKKIVGCIYKHLNVHVTEFTNDYMGLLLEIISCEKKDIILMRNFNINILHYDSDKDTTDFVGNMYASSFYPTISTPTQQYVIDSAICQRVILHQNLKTSRNQIVTLNRLSKENYCKMFFETNKKKD